MNTQRKNFAARYPRAIVKTERLTEAETVKLVASQDRDAYWVIAQSSL